MKRNVESSRISRRKFVRDGSLLTGLILSNTLFTQGAHIVPAFTAPPLLKAVVVGDSAMWGQGLSTTDKFSTKSVKAIGDLLGRPSKIEVNFAHSGASCRADKAAHAKFVNIHPTMFGSDGFDNDKLSELEKKFINDNDQLLTYQLYGEIPATFPTISHQVQTVALSAANSAEIVLMNGGANDLDFRAFLTPDENRSDFVTHYDKLLEEYTYNRVRSLLRQAREKFPKAVIIYTGYFTPFYPGKSNGAMKSLFEYLKKAPGWQVWLNDNAIFKVNTEQLVWEAQYRSFFGLTRSLHYSRRAVAEANADPALRGPGFLFVHPKFRAGNSVFESNSFFHREYKLGEVKDAAEKERQKHIVNFKHLDDIKELRAIPFVEGLQGRVKQLLQEVDSPSSLVAALHAYLKSPTSVDARNKAAHEVNEEIDRISNEKRASFLHPNEKGAQQYTDVIVKRYNERLHKINLEEDLDNFPKTNGKVATAASVMKRYGVDKMFGDELNVSQLMLVDSVGLEIKTASDSAQEMYDDVYLDLGNGQRWRLNFPLNVITIRPIYVEKMLDRKMFDPGKTDLFTMDGLGFHLSALKQFVLERKHSEDLKKGHINASYSSKPWKISSITLYINGLEVFKDAQNFALERGKQKSFSYPS